MAKTTKEINSSITSIRNRSAKQREHVQETAIQVVEHFILEGDARLATRLVEALGKGVQSEKLVNWFKEFGGMNWNTKTKQFNKAQTKTPNLEIGATSLWYEQEGDKDVMSDEEKLNNKVSNAIKLLTTNDDAIALLGSMGYVLSFTELEIENNEEEAA